MENKFKIKNKEFIEAVGTWHNALQKIYSEKAKVISPREFISARNSVQLNHYIWQNGSWTDHAVFYSAQNDPMLGVSPFLELKEAQKATEVHRQGRDAYLEQSVYDGVLKTAEQDMKKVPEKRSAFILPFSQTSKVSQQNNFDVLRFLARSGREAEKYFEKLGEKDISAVNFYLADLDYVSKQEQPFARELWLHSAGGDSYFYGGDRDFVGDYGVFGVSGSREAGARNPSLKEVLSYSRKYVLKKDWNEFESGMREILNRKKK